MERAKENEQEGERETERERERERDREREKLKQNEAPKEDISMRSMLALYDTLSNWATDDDEVQWLVLQCKADVRKERRMRAAFDGHWTEGTISGTTLTWNVGGTTDLIFTCPSTLEL